MPATAETIIYHNPNCGTSRKVLGMLRDAGMEPNPMKAILGLLSVRLTLPSCTVIFVPAMEADDPSPSRTGSLCCSR